jgi:hypothetical protein
MLRLHAALRSRSRALVFALTLAASAVLGASAVASAGAAPVWLCRPGVAPDPCAPGLSTTVYSAKLHKLGVQHPKAVKRPAIDCFYVYPTVSGQPTGNANRHIDPVERSIALYQAARYSQYCRVYAPMYRQVTLAGIGTGAKPTTAPNPALALSDVRAAFAYYLRHFNHGRGVVLIGHSQGSFVLRPLIAKDVDPKPAVRRRLLSAILLGGNTLVKPGLRGIGGDFKHIPACRSAAQLGCVIAFSTFDSPPPKNTLFGKPPVGPTGTKGDIVLCTNPAALSGGSGVLRPIFPSAPFDPTSILSTGISLLGLTQPHPNTVWFSEPGAYSARCVNSNGAHVLMITALHGAQVAHPSPDATWGLHLIDANIALGNLISIVHSESIAYAEQQAVAP